MAAPRPDPNEQPGEGTAGNEQSDVVCRNFRNKHRCRFADKCRYVHSEGSPIPVPVREPRPRGICNNWKAGTDCKYEKRCRFFHGTEAEAAAECEKRKVDLAAKAERKAQRAAVAVAAAENGTATTGGGQQQERRRSRRRVRPRKPRKDAEGNAVCRFFQQGNCSKAETCAFSHNPPVAPPPRAQVEKKTAQPQQAAGSRGGGSRGNAAGSGGNGGGGTAGRRNNRRRRLPRKKRPTRCYKFQENGDCEYGDECVYQHGDGDTRDFAQLRKRKAPGVCYNFKDHGECKFGERCRYAHNNEAPDLRTAITQ